MVWNCNFDLDDIPTDLHDRGEYWFTVYWFFLQYPFVLNLRASINDPRSLLNHKGSTGLYIFFEPIFLWALCSVMFLLKHAQIPMLSLQILFSVTGEFSYSYLVVNHRCLCVCLPLFLSVWVNLTFLSPCSKHFSNST